MKTLSIVYWGRVGLGIITALICTAARFNDFFISFSVGILMFLFSFYSFKWRYETKVKPSQLLTTGIGAYFLSWIVTWILSYTIFYWTPA